MDEPTLTRVMTAMATTLGTALSNQANTERAAQAASTARLVSAIRSSNTSDRKPKVDTTNQILKAERDAHDFTKEEAFDPDKHSVTLYRTEIKEKLQNKFCKDVIDYAGIEMYRRQSNALHQRIVEFETLLYISLGKERYEDGHYGSQLCRANNSTDNHTC